MLATVARPLEIMETVREDADFDASDVASMRDEISEASAEGREATAARPMARR